LDGHGIIRQQNAFCHRFLSQFNGFVDSNRLILNIPIRKCKKLKSYLRGDFTEFEAFSTCRDYAMLLIFGSDFVFELTIEKSFAGAHHLRNYRGKCENLHGHNWRVFVTVRGEALQDNGMLVDFKTIKKGLQQVLDHLDHRYLNETEPFDQLNPSCENLARYIFHQVKAALDFSENPHAWVHQVKVFETDTSAATYFEA
jgi:6-pyruvoyltetrahydropterin/6-carboxytetrahydropterin synthase